MEANMKTLEASYKYMMDNGFAHPDAKYIELTKEQHAAAGVA